MIEEIKKSHNPFKMRGSWIGFTLFCILFLIFTIRPFGCNPERYSWSDGVYFGVEAINFVGSSDCYNFPTETDIGILSLLIFILIFSTPGFLIGWGIHSLIRRIKNKIK